MFNNIKYNLFNINFNSNCFKKTKIIKHIYIKYNNIFLFKLIYIKYIISNEYFNECRGTQAR